MDFAFSSLRDFLTEQRCITKFQFLIFALDVANAIFYLHENHFVHRDIKAQNVLLFHTQKRDVAKLADYGFMLFPSTKQTICGTIGYMAPEMVQTKYIFCTLCVYYVFSSCKIKSTIRQWIYFLLECFFTK